MPRVCNTWWFLAEDKDRFSLAPKSHSLGSLGLKVQWVLLNLPFVVIHHLRRMQLPDCAFCKDSASKAKQPKCMTLAMTCHCTSPARMKPAQFTTKTYHYGILLVSTNNLESCCWGINRACTRNGRRKHRDLIVDQETFFLFAYYNLTKNLCKLNSAITSAEVIILSYYENITTSEG